MITREDAANAEVKEKLIAYNMSKLPDSVKTPLESVTFVSREEGELVGGITGTMFWRNLHIDFLWVKEEMRGSGLGRELLRKIETYAKENGCHLMLLDTFSFQAPGFYMNEGFEVCGEVKDHPKGYTLYYLMKRLT
ncbi:GNAT family N-acetyltransferase [Alkalihalobacillus sp. CinArs1]|uniref:GNAT family N-acetyltransferase n=1 Tax=Alkalihalobacillus sp. CinArs1 TaxID=2995314 RepID=UPI0022DE5C0E|nr:GNAT family N-acetyltransferase [Alkalihalobacillus sp. CinArs1]